MSRKKKNSLPQEDSKNIGSPEVQKPARDAKGRLLPGHTANPSGKSKKTQEFRDMCEHVLHNDGWDRWIERLHDSKTPAIVIHSMVEWMSAQVYGKPGVRTDQSGPSLEDFAKMMRPQIVFTDASKLEAAGFKVPKDDTQDEDK